MLVPGMGQVLLKNTNSVRTVEPLLPFMFLVEGKNMEVTSRVSVENFDLLLKLEFGSIQFREVIAEFNAIISEWPKMPFFSNEELKIEYISSCYEGQRAYTRMEHNINQILKFKNEEPDTEINTCTYISHEIKLTDLQRGALNLKNRFTQVQRDWAPESIKTDLSKKNSLVLFCKQFAEFSTVWDDYTEDMLGALQELSDRIYPEILVSQFERNCTEALPGDGESFIVTSCRSSNLGYRCQIEVAKATETKEYARCWPVHYEDIHLAGENENQIFGKDIVTGEIKLLDCTVIVSPDFPSCIVTDLEVGCKTGLALEKFEDILDYCNFASGKPELTTPLPNGGVFIQGDSNVQISNGEVRIPKIPPIIVYSPLPITIRENEEDLVYPPSINVANLITVESKLTEYQIKDLLITVRRNMMWENIEISDYIRYALIALQLVLFPMAIFSLVHTIKQRKTIGKFLNKKRNGGEQENFRRNTYLLKKVRK